MCFDGGGLVLSTRARVATCVPGELDLLFFSVRGAMMDGDSSGGEDEAAVAIPVATPGVGMAGEG